MGDKTVTLKFKEEENRILEYDDPISGAKDIELNIKKICEKEIKNTGLNAKDILNYTNIYENFVHKILNDFIQVQIIICNKSKKIYNSYKILDEYYKIIIFFNNYINNQKEYVINIDNTDDKICIKGEFKNMFNNIGCIAANYKYKKNNINLKDKLNNTNISVDDFCGLFKNGMDFDKIEYKNTNDPFEKFIALYGSGNKDITIKKVCYRFLIIILQNINIRISRYNKEIINFNLCSILLVNIFFNIIKTIFEANFYKEYFKIYQDISQGLSNNDIGIKEKENKEDKLEENKEEEKRELNEVHELQNKNLDSNKYMSYSNIKDIPPECCGNGLIFKPILDITCDTNRIDTDTTRKDYCFPYSLVAGFLYYILLDDDKRNEFKAYTTNDCFGKLNVSEFYNYIKNNINNYNNNNTKDLYEPNNSIRLEYKFVDLRSDDTNIEAVLNNNVHIRRIYHDICFMTNYIVKNNEINLTGIKKENKIDLILYEILEKVAQYPLKINRSMDFVNDKFNYNTYLNDIRDELIKNINFGNKIDKEHIKYLITKKDKEYNINASEKDFLEELGGMNNVFGLSKKISPLSIKSMNSSKSLKRHTANKSHKKTKKSHKSNKHTKIKTKKSHKNKSNTKTKRSNKSNTKRSKTNKNTNKTLISRLKSGMSKLTNNNLNVSYIPGNTKVADYNVDHGYIKEFVHNYPKLEIKGKNMYSMTGGYSKGMIKTLAF